MQEHIKAYLGVNADFILIEKCMNICAQGDHIVKAADMVISCEVTVDAPSGPMVETLTLPTCLYPLFRCHLSVRN